MLYLEVAGAGSRWRNIWILQNSTSRSSGVPHLHKNYANVQFFHIYLRKVLLALPRAECSPVRLAFVRSPRLQSHAVHGKCGLLFNRKKSLNFLVCVVELYLVLVFQRITCRPASCRPAASVLFESRIVRVANSNSYCCTATFQNNFVQHVFPA